MCQFTIFTSSPSLALPWITYIKPNPKMDSSFISILRQVDWVQIEWVIFLSLLRNSKIYMTCPSPFLQSSTYTSILKIVLAKSLLLLNNYIHTNSLPWRAFPTGTCYKLRGSYKNLLEFRFKHASLPPKTTQWSLHTILFFFFLNRKKFYHEKLEWDSAGL